MKNLFLKLSIATILSLFISCVDSNDIKPETPIFQNYSLYHNKNNNSCFALANFRLHKENGTILEIRGNDKIKLTCNGQKTGFSLVGSIWNLDDCKTGANFSFTKENGDTFKNTIKMSDLRDIDIPKSFTGLKIGENYEFKWVGKPIQEDETLEIHIEQRDDKSKLIGAETIISRMINSETIEIKKEQLSKFTKGKATFKLTRIREFEIQETDQDAGGVFDANTSVSKEIVLE
ncbi:MAG: hypothetical protein CR961_01330 [Polaribacter sp.]|nr:MAG: hypothetical protein CR961_01330 [Polaribacter sp.]